MNNEPKQSLREGKSLPSLVKTSLRTYLIKGKARQRDREGGIGKSVNKCHLKKGGNAIFSKWAEIDPGLRYDDPPILRQMR